MNQLFREHLRDYVQRLVSRCPRNMRKIVLCRPRGGLNDMLCQIDKCRKYAARSGRELWVDAGRSGFHDCLGNYFKPCSGMRFGSPIGKVCTDDSCFPVSLVNRVDSYESVYDSSLGNYVKNETCELLTFDFHSCYDERVLVHEQCGGGLTSVRTLARLRLEPKVRKAIMRTIKNLGAYDAVHVRNTDLTTDYKTFFQSLCEKITGKLVVCTDDFRCHQYAKEIWGDRLAVIHSVPDKSGLTLHESASEDQYAMNLDVLTDLFVLAFSRNFFYCKTDKGHVSGFAQLVESLRSSPALMKKLIH